jgi:ubiquinone/menaquinone biosynthesis C-methylase UbiE
LCPDGVFMQYMNPNNSMPETGQNSSPEAAPKTGFGQADGNLSRLKSISLSPDLMQIWQHWEQRGKRYGLSPSASWVDETMLHREGEILSRYIKTDDAVLDAGCANGYTTIQLARSKRIRITGIDYAASMIEHAQLNLNRAGHTKGAAFFKVNNFLNLDFPDNTFDKVITKRCLINLGTQENQKRAMLEAHRVLRPGGLFLVSEVSEQTADKLNRIRQRFGLETMTPLWHNCYLDETDFLNFAGDYFEVKNPLRFSSTYYLVTWVLYPYFVRSGQRNYRSFLHKLSAVMPQVGDWGLQKLYILKKRG